MTLCHRGSQTTLHHFFLKALSISIVCQPWRIDLDQHFITTAKIHKVNCLLKEGAFLPVGNPACPWSVSVFKENFYLRLNLKWY